MAWRNQRKAEHDFFRRAQAPQLEDDIIRQVTVETDSDGDFIFRFETLKRRYALAIVVSDSSNLGWRECHALADAMQIAERGTRITNETFLSILQKLKDKYGRVQDPSVQNHRLVGIIHPSQGTFQHSEANTIMQLGIKSDDDGDFVFRATTRDKFLYTICLETYPAGSSLTILDCKAFVSALRILEPGDHVSKVDFLTYGLLIREKYNFVKPAMHTYGRGVSMSILASSVEDEEALHPMFESVARELQKEVNNSNHSVNENHCPYPGITYVKALKESGQAQVYAGRNAKGEKVAVKVFSTDEDPEDATETYKTELRMLLKMSAHPNVVEVIDFFETPDPALVMRLIDGEDLMDYLQKNGSCDEASGRKLLTGIAKGLCHLHSHGIVHRDLKTLNILRQTDGTPIIIDLGLGSTLPRRSTIGSNMTVEELCSAMASTHISEQTNAMKGTIPWMPPEMITDQKWSEKTDVYAFGIIMWEVFSGMLPFADKQGIAMLLGIAAGDRPPLSAVSHISIRLRSLMQACWEADPKRRPSMRHVRDLLVGNDPRQIFRSIDTDDSGTLDFGEFVMFLQRYVPGRVDPGRMHELFKILDHDNSSGITIDEFEEFWHRAEKGGVSFALSSSLGKQVRM